MAIPVLVMGQSGSGKTYSVKTFQPDEVGIISVEESQFRYRLREKCRQDGWKCEVHRKII